MLRSLDDGKWGTRKEDAAVDEALHGMESLDQSCNISEHPRYISQALYPLVIKNL
jgi:hypothetical protein